METLGLKNINMLTKEQFDGVENPAADELYAVSSSGFGKPSSKYINLTFGASGTEYTAPADGWFAFGKRASATGQYLNVIYISPAAIPYFSDVGSGGTSHILGHLIPVSKGQIVRVNYNAGGDVTVCRFIFDEGEI